MNNLLLSLPVFIPLMAAVVALLIPKQGALLGRLAAFLTLAITVQLVAEVYQSTELQMMAGNWPAGLAIKLQVDGISALFLLMSAVLYVVLSLYANQYFHRLTQRSDFWVLWGFLFTSLHALFISGDLFNLYFCLELLSVSAVGLTLLSASRDAFKAAGRYLIVSLLGSLLFLAGVAILIAKFGAADIHLLKELVANDSQSWLAFLLMNAGLMLKAALFPVHFWLPATHAVAPAPVSAALSALVVKACLFLIMRLWLELFLPLLTHQSAMVMGSLGTLAILLGAWQALIAKRLKHLAAWSTVSQVGYLVLFIPLLHNHQGSELYEPLLGAMVLMALTHAFAKSSLFLCIGRIQHAYGHDEIEGLQGLARLMPVTCFSIALAGLAIIGLPPGGGFLSKWLLLSGAVEMKQWFYTIAIAIGTLGAGAYLFRLLCIAFANQPPGVSLQRVTLSESPGLVLAIGATLVLGFFAYPIWQLVGSAGWSL